MTDIQAPVSHEEALTRLRTRIAAAEYRVVRQYPEAPKPPLFSRNLIHTMALPDINCFETDLQVFRALMAEHNEAVYDYWDEVHTLFLSFRDDLADVFGMTDHPKEERLFAAAWERARGRGFDAVAVEYAALVDLAR